MPLRVTTYDARDLIGDDSQVRILLDSQQYYLRITRAGKLILTKYGQINGTLKSLKH